MNPPEINEENMIEGHLQPGGTYFMFFKDEIVFIGSSMNVVTAVAAKSRRGVLYDRYSFIPFSSKEEALRKALLCIFEYKPKDNTGLPQNKFFVRNIHVKDRYGINRPELNRWINEELIEIHTFGSDVYLEISELKKVLEESGE